MRAIAKKIKERLKTKDPRELDRAKNIPRHLAKKFAISTLRLAGSGLKEAAIDDASGAKDNDPTQYAVESIQEKGVNTAKDATRYGTKAVKKIIRHARRKIREKGQERGNAKSAVKEYQRNSTKNVYESRRDSSIRTRQNPNATTDTTRPAPNAIRPPADTARPAYHPLRETAKKSVNTARQAEKGIRQTSSAAKRVVKMVNKSVKTVDRSIKTGQRAIRTAQHTAKAAQAAHKMLMLAKQAAIKAAKAAVAAAKVFVKAVAAALKALAAAIKAIIAAIAAGGWIVLVVLLVCAVIYVLFFSPFGIFQADQSERPLTEIMSEIEAGLQDKIDEIIAQNPTDEAEIDIDGDSLASNWRDVIAVYAVKTTMDKDNGADVLTFDDERVERLKTVFWDMNELEYEISTREETTSGINPDGTTYTEVKTISVLTIRLKSKDALEMADTYNFNKQQRDALDMLLSLTFREQFALLIGPDDGGSFLTPEQLEALYHDLPVGTRGAEIVKLAASRLGDPYNKDKRGQGKYVDCSYFARWCYRQIGIELPGTAAAQAKFCVENELTISRNDLVPGDLIFYSHHRNNRYMNITHVAVYAGNGMIIDASSKRGEVVYRKNLSGQILYARPHIL